MKRFFVFFLMMFLIGGLTAVNAQDSSEKDLRWAKSLMDRGDYVYAVEKFEDIARSQYAPPRIKKEAMYYAGYCHVKNNDPWQATRVFERFLDQYDDGISAEFVPDALYVLGRVYEENGDKEKAIKVYRRCKRNYPGNSFARKSQERLLTLKDVSGTDPFDDSNNGGNDDNYDNHGGSGNHHGGQSQGISREIRQLISIAETISNSFTRDQMLLEGSARARTGEDFVALAKAINNDFTRQQLFDKVRANPNYQRFTARSMIEFAGFINNSYSRDQFLVNLASDFAARDYVSNFDFVDMSAAMQNDMIRQQLFDVVQKSPAFKVMSAMTVVDLAKTCQNTYIHDQLLLSAAQKNPYSYRELRILADACTNAFIKTQIIQTGHRDHSPASTRTAAIKVATDPFSDFSFNKAQLKRVSAFMNAIDNRKDVRKTVSQLKKSDLNSATVREYMEKFRTIEKFENIHQDR